MTDRITTSIVHFDTEFSFSGADRTFPAGDYQITDIDEPLPGLTMMAWHRTATYLEAPPVGSTGRITQSFRIQPGELADILERDRPKAAASRTAPSPRSA